MVMMRMRSDDDTFSAGQISPPDSTGGSDWAVRQLSAEIKEREKRLMRLQFCSSTGTPAAAPTTSQNNPRARKQPGTGAKHQPMTSHQFPQPPTPNPLVVKSFPPSAASSRPPCINMSPPPCPGHHGVPRRFQDSRTAVSTRRRPVVRPVRARARPSVAHRCSHQ